MAQQLPKRLINVTEFEGMFASGVFKGDERLELLEGGIYEMSPVGAIHMACVNFLSWFFNVNFSERFTVSTQNPIRVNEFSAPQPDIALLVHRDDFYRNAMPTNEDVLLVIEVADSPLETDRRYKMPLYAQGEIPEAWLICLPEERIEVYSEPKNGTYQLTRIFQRDDIVKAQTHDEIEISVNDILG